MKRFPEFSSYEGCCWLSSLPVSRKEKREHAKRTSGMQDHAECHQDSPVLRLWRGGRKLCPGSSYSRCLRSLKHTNTSITLINHVIDQCTYSWHGDHEEIDAIPIGQCILPFSCICEVRGVATIFKLWKSKLNTHTLTKWLQDQIISGQKRTRFCQTF